MVLAATPYSLDFDESRYTLKTLSLEGKEVKVRAYEDIVYVKYPVDAEYQTLNIYIPEAYYEGKTIGNYTQQNAPIFLPNMIGGYRPSKAAVLGEDPQNNFAPPPRIGQAEKGKAKAEGAVHGDFPGASMRSNTVLVALSKGYVVALPGARGNSSQNTQGIYTGKAPAAIVDLKAAVRYLRYNDAKMAGDATKIISNGTSAGGALSALLGATGNDKAYESYLKELGAAEAQDDIFAVSSYCPITNLEHADMAYEWLFNIVQTYQSRRMMPMSSGEKNDRMPPMPMQGGNDRMSPPEGMPPRGNHERTGQAEEAQSLTPDQIALSNRLKALFPVYVNSLRLKKEDGSLLGLDEQGNGTFKEYLQSFVIASAQKALENGKDVSSLSWISIKDGRIESMNFNQYVRYMGRMKTPPAFDALDLSSPENSEFGTNEISARHFSTFSKENDPAGGMAEPSLIALMNPMEHIGVQGVNTAKYWRIRHGSIDKDTSLAIPLILATKLQNSGLNVDFAFAWDKGHSGDYDLEELFAWMEKISLARSKSIGRFDDLCLHVTCAPPPKH